MSQRDLLGFCQQLFSGEKGERIDLQEDFATTMAQAKNGEDMLFVISWQEDVVTGHSVTNDQLLSSTVELRDAGVILNVTAYLIHSSWLPRRFG